MSRPTKRQKARQDALRGLGCIITSCRRPAAIHHCLTGAGGRKDEDKVLPLCHLHHQGDEGIHTLSRPVWEAKYGTEEELMAEALERLSHEAMNWIF